MSFNISDTVKSTFDRIASKASLGVGSFALGLLIILFLGTAATGAATMVNSALAGIIGLVTAAVYIAGVASLTVGSLRAFDQEELEKGMFTENIVWPFLRMFGSNIIVTHFIYLAVLIVLYPTILLTMGASGMLEGTAETMPELGNAAIAGLGISGGITAVVVLYVFAALSLSLPRIAISDKRLFQSLDQSVQVTKGNRLKIAATILPFLALIGIGLTALVALSSILGGLIYLTLVVLGGLYWLALLAELNDRL